MSNTETLVKKPDKTVGKKNCGTEGRKKQTYCHQ